MELEKYVTKLGRCIYTQSASLYRSPAQAHLTGSQRHRVTDSEQLHSPEQAYRLTAGTGLQ